MDKSEQKPELMCQHIFCLYNWKSCSSCGLNLTLKKRGALTEKQGVNISIIIREVNRDTKTRC